MPAQRFPTVPAASDFAASSSVTDDGGDDVSLLTLLLASPFCIGTAVPTVLQSRQRGGTAALCGTAEFTSPSSPPLLYRKQTLSGNVAGCNYTGGCAAPGSNGGFAFSWQGVYALSAATCGLTNTSTEFFYGSDGVSNCGTNPVHSSSTPMGVPFTPTNTTTATLINDSQVQQRWNYPGTCSPANQKFLGDAFANLSDPDTDADAIARLLAGSPFPAFANCLAPATCALAAYQSRTGTTFQYTDAQFQIAATGLNPMQLYCAAVDIWRRPYGTGSFALFETIFVSGNTDNAGNLALSGNVPNDKGFETYATNSRYWPPL